MREKEKGPSLPSPGRPKQPLFPLLGRSAVLAHQAIPRPSSPRPSSRSPLPPPLQPSATPAARVPAQRAAPRSPALARPTAQPTPHPGRFARPSPPSAPPSHACAAHTLLSRTSHPRASGSAAACCLGRLPPVPLPNFFLSAPCAAALAHDAEEPDVRAHAPLSEHLHILSSSLHFPSPQAPPSPVSLPQTVRHSCPWPSPSLSLG
jgi:hypothetical protein